MEILLLRHAVAAEARPGQADAERPLTAEGKQKLQALLRRLRKAGVRPALILTSPYLRARQSAEIARGILAPDAILVPARALAPGSAPQEAWDEIRLYADQPSVLCASHEPLCSQLAAFLLGAPEMAVDFKKGAVMRIDVESASPRPKGALRWLVSPRLA